MKIGVFDHFDADGGSLAALYEWRLKLVEAYDRTGIDIYHLAEHHSTPLGMAPSRSVFLSAVAQRTKRLRFGPMVYTLSLHHPLRVMEEICMLDQMSGGRVELGVGRGVSPLESAFYGVDPKQSRDIYVEVLDIVLKAFQTQTLDYEGKFHRFKGTPIVIAPLQKPHPPLWYGVLGPESADWPAQHAMNIATNALADARNHRPLSRCVAEGGPRSGENAAARHEPPYRHRGNRCRGADHRAALLRALA
jgi:alkanesulfonate monooxygenase SsuD/methylene tetrahydromethanopterin reductase-like flavin-dependent oxidoreductase (luciferase family)